MSRLLLFLLPILLSASWMYSRASHPSSLSDNSNILLLTAHPDDEAMFFAPTLLSLAALGANIHLLCLSTGDADGLGAVRERELVAAATMLGVPEHNIHIANHPELRDGMSEVWGTSTIVSVITSQLADVPIDAVVSFDDRGISGHANHIATSVGARSWARERGAQVWELTSVGMLRKYSGFLDAVARWSRKEGRAVFVSSLGDVRAAQRAMTEAHVSQMRWFRWGWIVLSRYMVVNELERVDA